MGDRAKLSAPGWARSSRSWFRHAARIPAARSSGPELRGQRGRAGRRPRRNGQREPLRTQDPRVAGQCRRAAKCSSQSVSGSARARPVSAQECSSCQAGRLSAQPGRKTLCAARVNNHVAIADRLGRKRRRVPHSIDDLDQRLVNAEHVIAHGASLSHVPHGSQPVAVRRPTGRHIKGAPMAVATCRSHGDAPSHRLVPSGTSLDARHRSYRQPKFRCALQATWQSPRPRRCFPTTESWSLRTASHRSRSAVPRERRGAPREQRVWLPLNGRAGTLPGRFRQGRRRFAIDHARSRDRRNQQVPQPLPGPRR